MMKKDAATQRQAADGVLNAVDLHRHGSGSPLYEQLADALARSIDDGVLESGDRLPPHRELARTLRINVTTVTRAIARLKARGLVESRPGRGTVVGPVHRQPEAQFQSAPMAHGSGIDLSVNRPATDKYLRVLEKLLPSLPRDRRYDAVKDYQSAEGPEWARVAAAAWMRGNGLAVQPEQLVLVDGAQQGLASVLRATMQPGEALLADTVSYQGVNALCRTLGLELHGVAGDSRGMSPEALERACQEYLPRALFLVPCLHNPTTLTLDQDRREKLLRVAALYDLLVIEDDVYRPLLEEKPTPLFNLSPDSVFYITALSKCAAPGIRFGVVAAPQAYAADVAAAMRVDCWSVSPLTALIATRMIESGELDALVQAQREELRVRNAILDEVLASQRVSSAPVCTHAWLHLPDPWRGSEFARACHDHGVELLPGEAFTLRHEQPPHAVRINLAAARSRDELERGLRIISDLVRRGHRHTNRIV
ncbi:MAG: PLP-dependent aminotransferase family protein [Aquisalimonadaceae bacterium]